MAACMLSLPPPSVSEVCSTSQKALTNILHVMLLNRKQAAGQGGVQVWQEPMAFIALRLL